MSVDNRIQAGWVIESIIRMSIFFDLTLSVTIATRHGGAQNWPNMKKNPEDLKRFSWQLETLFLVLDIYKLADKVKLLATLQLFYHVSSQFNFSVYELDGKFKGLQKLLADMQNSRLKIIYSIILHLATHFAFSYFHFFCISILVWHVHKSSSYKTTFLPVGGKRIKI